MNQFSDSAVLKKGWVTFKDNAGLLLGLTFLFAIVYAVYLVLAAMVETDAVVTILTLLFLIFALIFQVGYIGIMIGLIDGEKKSFGDLFAHMDRALKYLGTILLYLLVVAVGTVLFIIPGVIWSTTFYLAPYLVVDKGLGPIEAMKMSAELTRGNRWDILGFIILASIVMNLGMLALFFGILVSMPVAMLATAAMYRALSPSGKMA